MDLKQEQIFMPEEKIDILKVHLSHLMSKVTHKVSDLANAIGNIISISTAFGPVIWLITRSTQALLNGKQYTA